MRMIQIVRAGPEVNTTDQGAVERSHSTKKLSRNIRSEIKTTVIAGS